MGDLNKDVFINKNNNFKDGQGYMNLCDSDSRSKDEYNHVIYNIWLNYNVSLYL